MKTLGAWYVLLSVGASLLTTDGLEAASLTLTTEQREAALAMGRQSIISDRFGAEWRVSGDGAADALVVMTPFHRVALAARNAAFKNEELKPSDVDALLRAEEGKLTFWATLRGTKDDFARFYIPVLVSGQQQIRAAFTQNERTARRESDGRYTARCLYVFPAEGLRPGQPLTLVVKDADGKPVATFTVDLSTMR